MKTIEQLKDLTDEKFQENFGVERNTFFLMLDKLNQQLTESHQKGGRPPKIDTLNRLCIFFAYYKTGRTMKDIASEYKISVSTTYDIIKLVEKTLLLCKEFQLPDKSKTESEMQSVKNDLQNFISERKRNLHKKLIE